MQNVDMKSHRNLILTKTKLQALVCDNVINTLCLEGFFSLYLANP